ncbi:diaminopimelate epimerase [Buchnera aphidicola (Pemphigus obesinymphae)]|uniref:diaminopimelate epimerase n=1 Tax=Buchnera aphidicola TaxID=9 RepID=UPI002237F871|nr:diaminopimelate epimerase [Buchnera aphidicola]MCW5196729.1 diaminopimelate epimerase [Buchnera aphidicola (Pemphigus obesinymphae)]
MFFSKMHGLGNDFMVIDNITQKMVNFTPALIRNLSNRNLGIGFDQLLLINQSNDPTIDFYYRIFNADGSEVEQCGNGVRCFAYFVYLKGLTKKKKISVRTKKTHMILEILENNQIKVNMGEPVFDLALIPCQWTVQKKFYTIKIFDKNLPFGIVSMGNPHCVTIVKNLSAYEVESIGSSVSNNVIFPNKINVGFMEIINSDNINLRVYERGVGETKACGSGACAAVAIGIYNKLLSEQVKVSLSGGNLYITWKGSGNNMYMIGSATHVYDGYIFL